MDFETDMENLTSVCDGDCDCSPDPALLADFKRAIHALGGKWKLEILFALMNGAVRFGALRRSIGGTTQHMLPRSCASSSRTAWCREPSSRRNP
ncbi:hypothetical protein ABIB95_002049 [Bradyrhizobium sp. LA2.1]